MLEPIKHGIEIIQYGTNKLIRQLKTETFINETLIPKNIKEDLG